MMEKSLERKLVNAVKLLGGMAIKFTSPGMRGVMDRIVLIPGKIYFIEMKAKDKKLSPLQRKRKWEFESLGFIVLKIDSIEDIIRFYQSEKNRIDTDFRENIRKIKEYFE